MSSSSLPQILNPDDPLEPFPEDHEALSEPNGLIALGGDLSAHRLLAAYRRGIFPWYEEGQPILWWTPDPRLILDPRHLHVSRSLRKTLRHGDFLIRCDCSFEQVIRACAEPRYPGGGTWISPEIIQAYANLNELGYAHSIEAWHGSRLVGGLYGVALGAGFFGESMFSHVPDASKACLQALARLLAPIQGSLIDCQVPSSHLISLGAVCLSRADFRDRLRRALATPGPDFVALGQTGLETLHNGKPKR